MIQAVRWMFAMMTPLVASAATPEPSAPDASGPPALQRPADGDPFLRYRSFDPEPRTTDWRAANDEVGRLGGFMGHMRPAPEHDDPTGAGQR